MNKIENLILINYNEEQYLNLLKKLVNKTEKTGLKNNRTGIPTINSFGEQLVYDLTDMKIPLLTTKFVSFKSILHELYWMYLLGNPDMSYLKANNIKMWDHWAVYNTDHPNGTIGPMYGQIVRGKLKGEVDQLQQCIDTLKTNPNSRRAIFSAYNPNYQALDNLSFEENIKAGRGVLSNCHSAYNQFYIDENNELQLSTLMRSQDYYLGGPYNHVFYAVLTHLVAHILNIKASKLIFNMNDCHLYENTLTPAKEQLTRLPYNCPTISIDSSIKSLEDWKSIDQIQLHNYQHHAAIKAPVAI